MSDEGKKQLTKFAEDFALEYPLARGNGSAYGVSGYPTYVLVAPDGTVVKKGYPTAADIDALLGSVSMAPPMPDSSAFSSLRKSWAKLKYADVDKALTKLAEADLDNEEQKAATELRGRFDRLAKSTLAKIEGFRAGPNYYRASEQLGRMQKRWKGLPQADAAKAMLKYFSEDDTIKNEIAAGKMLAHALRKYGSNKSSDKKKLAKALRALRKKYKGTYAAKASLKARN